MLAFAWIEGTTTATATAKIENFIVNEIEVFLPTDCLLSDV